MSEFADENLAALVRQMMPSRRIDWIVQVTDNHEEACALFNRNVLRVHRLWQAEVYDAGLHLVPKHHLLSARRVGSEILRGIASRIAIDVWEARLIKNHKGRLTEKHGYIARTPDREHVAFGGCAATAEIGVLRELRSAISKRARLARERARRIEDYQELLRSRSVRGRYDADLRVDLANYERWLPKHLRETFKRYEEGVPLRVIENEAVDLVPSLGDRELADLIYQLDRDVALAEEETDRRALDRWFDGGG